jgi:hypothetical protein
MPTPTKPPSKRATRPAVRKPVKPTPLSKPSLRFYHSESLRAETIVVLDAIEQGPDPLLHRAALADLAAKLTSSGMDYYFLRPLRLAKAGFVVEQSTHLAVAGALRILAPITRNILLRMDRAQLLTVCAHVRQLME